MHAEGGVEEDPAIRRHSRRPPKQVFQCTYAGAVRVRTLDWLAELLLVPVLAELVLGLLAQAVASSSRCAVGSGLETQVTRRFALAAD